MKVWLSEAWWKLKETTRKNEDDSPGKCDLIKRTIYLKHHPHDSEEFQLDTVLHELLHGVAWDHDEEWVSRSARDIARILLRLGWRKHS